MKKILLFLVAIILCIVFAIPVFAANTTWNPSDKNAAISLASGNLYASYAAGGSFVGVRATNSKSSGAYAFSITTPVNGGDIFVGIGNASATLSNYIGQDANGIGYNASNGDLYTNGGIAHTGGAAFNTTNTMTVAVNLTANTVSFYKDGVAQYTGIPIPFAGAVYPMIALFTASDSAIGIFYGGPAGFFGFDSALPPTGFFILFH